MSAAPAPTREGFPPARWLTLVADPGERLSVKAFSGHTLHAPGGQAHAAVVPARLGRRRSHPALIGSLTTDASFGLPVVRRKDRHCDGRTWS
jgi:hypothetical protein